MLERITLGQNRFVVPGVAADPRGIVFGKLGLLLFASLDGVVSWLRLFADEESLDELLAGGTRLERVRTALGSRSFALFIPAGSSYLLDRAARLARLAGGSAFTGTAKHFVLYRDERSPYGYDVGELAGRAGAAGFVVYPDDEPLAFEREATLEVGKLILRLSLRRSPPGAEIDGELLLTVVPGLGHGLLGYLLRNRVKADVARVTVAQGSAFTAPGAAGGYLLVRVRDLPARILGSLRGVPGVTLFRNALDNVAVELGYVHPLALSSVSSLFGHDRLWLMWGEEDRVDTLPTPAFSSAESLASVRLMGEPVRAVRAADSPPEGALAIDVPVRLVPTLNPVRRVVGTLVPWREAARLKKLVYALPPAMLRGHRLATSERGLLLLAGDGVEVIPLGTLLYEAGPGLLVPLGLDLVPRVATDVLTGALAHEGEGSPERITVFAEEGGPFSVAAGALAPLERRLLARIPVPVVAASAEAPPSPPAPTLVNDPLGRFALWGFPGPRGAPPLPLLEKKKP